MNKSSIWKSFKIPWLFLGLQEDADGTHLNGTHHFSKYIIEAGIQVTSLMGLRKNTSLKEKFLGNDPRQTETAEQSNFASSQILGSCLQEPQQNVRTSIFQ